MYLYVYLNTENSFAADRGQFISLCIYAPVLCETRISRLIERHHYSPVFMIYIPEDNVYIHIRMVYIRMCIYTYVWCTWKRKLGNILSVDQWISGSSFCFRDIAA